MTCPAPVVVPVTGSPTPTTGGGGAGAVRDAWVLGDDTGAARVGSALVCVVDAAWLVVGSAELEVAAVGAVVVVAGTSAGISTGKPTTGGSCTAVAPTDGGPATWSAARAMPIASAVQAATASTDAVTDSARRADT